MDYSGFINKINEKYPYISLEDATDLVDTATAKLYNLLYPYGEDIDTKTDFDVPKRYNYWIMCAVTEMIERQGISSAVGYQENGLHITFDNAQLSYGLISEITPFAGTPKRTVSDVGNS